jgi:hypothetical protein
VSREISYYQNVSQEVLTASRPIESPPSGAAGNRKRQRATGVAGTVITQMGRQVTAGKHGFYIRLNNG